MRTVRREMKRVGVKIVCEIKPSCGQKEPFKICMRPTLERKGLHVLAASQLSVPAASDGGEDHFAADVAVGVLHTCRRNQDVDLFATHDGDE